MGQVSKQYHLTYLLPVLARIYFVLSLNPATHRPLSHRNEITDARVLGRFIVYVSDAAAGR